MTEIRKHACTICARRKVKCDRTDPCSNCQKAGTQCSYEAPAPPKPRKRAADEDLLARLALYEELMKKNGVDFTQHVDVWRSSGLEAKAEDGGEAAPTELCLWSTLCPELKYPPVMMLRHKDDPFFHPSPSISTVLTNPQNTYELHPEPKHIYFLWQTFVETVNPLIKIIHIPTLQKRILEATWNLAQIDKSLAALMFSIYTLSVTSLSAEDCQSSLGQDRGVLITRYRTATLRALTEADFMTTKELEVLQAMVLFVFSNPESELSSSLTAVAIRTGQMMGLHKIEDSKLSFFDKEMRIRLWWQIKGLDSRVRAVSTPGIKLSRSDFGEIRLPFNINDADLHPDMLEPPIQHNGPTEMIIVLMKFEVTSWVKSSPRAAKVFESMAPGFWKGKTPTNLGFEAVNELEATYTEKYLSKLDRCVPFHDLTYAMANLALARMRFMLYHPRGRAVNGEDVYMTRQESDLLFNASLSFIQYVDVGFKSKFSSQVFTHLTSTYHLDAYIYLISELRKRDTGPRIAMAWKLVDGLYADHAELIDNETPLFTALGNLVLEAWETRRKVLTEADAIPSCIELVWAKRRVANAGAEVAADPGGLEGWEFNVGDFDWNYWNNFIRF
ncbi:unnamed protein product [Fusarium equiseti]|uniref:Zn(2)-C6 fungal-type domain-containing protein n=1 Tax=Fusarium equiseti TaxID=61235 RepID=A0A8J2NH82_FUSEQ|nr:unnamed protein product [Fusarium equiseti]